MQIVSRSSSKQKRKKDMKDLSLAEDIYRPKVKAVSTTKTRKSHQGSYIIGAEPSDWPLEPKWKEGTSKLRGALRRK